MMAWHAVISRRSAPTGMAMRIGERRACLDPFEVSGVGKSGRGELLRLDHRPADAHLERILTPDLTADEQAGLVASADVLAKAMAEMDAAV